MNTATPICNGKVLNRKNKDGHIIATRISKKEKTCRQMLHVFSFMIGTSIYLCNVTVPVLVTLPSVTVILLSSVSL